MLYDLWKTAGDALMHNQFFAGGAVLMAGGFLANWARKLPQYLQGWLMRTFTTTVDVSSRDRLFWWIQEWLAAQPVTMRRGALSARTDRNGGGSGGVSTATLSYPGAPDEAVDLRPPIYLSPAPGGMWFRYSGVRMHAYRERKEMTGKDGFQDFSETLTLCAYSRDRGVLAALLSDARDLAVPPSDDAATLYTPHYDSWNSLCRLPLRRPASVVLAGDIREDLFADLDQFLSSADWYSDRGVPYHRGYLLSGPPGNGKSSLISAAAHHLRYNVATVSLADKDLTPDRLRNLFARLPDRTLLAIEDVDRDLVIREDTEAYVAGDGPPPRDTQLPNKLPFSAVLNLLDGIGTPEGRILFMTTNHRDRLDPALVRPGRVDREYFLGDANYAQALRLFERFFPAASYAQISGFAEAGAGKSMATLQGHLLRHRDDPDAAVDAASAIGEPESVGRDA